MQTKIIRSSNSEVTDHYLDVIEDAVANVRSNKKVTISASYEQTIKARLRGEKVIFWAQGIPAEESFMRHQSHLRSGILSSIELAGLKSAVFWVFCSDYMKEHFENKYKMRFKEGSYYVMPCYNTGIVNESFFTSRKYSDNVFTYVGSLSVWQRFRDIVRIYKTIEPVIDNTRLDIYTEEKEAASSIIREFELQNVKIDHVPKDMLPSVLADAKYGFVLREDNEVNRVSTPTKISTYLANGIIPIYSDCLRSFSERARTMKYTVEENEILDKIKHFCSNGVDVKEIFEEYSRVFSDYYSDTFHKNNLMRLVQSAQNKW